MNILNIFSRCAAVSVFILFFTSASFVYAKPPNILGNVKLPKELLGHNTLWVPKANGSDWALITLPGREPTEFLSKAPFNKALFLKCQGGKLHLSKDNGTSWEKPVFNSPSEDAVAAVFHPAKPNKMFLATNRRFLISLDSGKSWSPSKTKIPFKWRPHSVHVSKVNPSRLYFATRGNGIFRSDDEGMSWVNINSGLPKAIGAAPVAPIESVVIHPVDPDIMYIALEAMGVYKTTDGGGNWRRLSKGLPTDPSRRTYPWKLAIDPLNPKRLLAAASWPVNSALIEKAIFLSSDEGETWKKIRAVQKPVLDISFLPSAAELAVVLTEDGVVKFSN